MGRRRDGTERSRAVQRAHLTESRFMRAIFHAHVVDRAVLLASASTLRAYRQRHARAIVLWLSFEFSLRPDVDISAINLTCDMLSA